MAKTKKCKPGEHQWRFFGDAIECRRCKEEVTPTDPRWAKVRKVWLKERKDTGL